MVHQQSPTDCHQIEFTRLEPADNLVQIVENAGLLRETGCQFLVEADAADRHGRAAGQAAYPTREAHVGTGERRAGENPGADIEFSKAPPL